MNRFFVTYKGPLAVITGLIILCGVYISSTLPVSLFPDITFPKIKIIADSGLQPVERMMVTVTQPLENAIKQVPGVSTIRSTTSRGSCEISAFLNEGTNVSAAKQEIESRIAKIRTLLPVSTDIAVEKMDPSILPVIGYTLEARGSAYTPIDLKTLALYKIKPFLSQVNGVSEVRVIGGRSKEFRVEPNQQKMTALGITSENLIAAFEQTNFVESNGYLTDYRFFYLAVTDAAMRNIMDIENIVISGNNKRVVQVKDIASVKIGEAAEFTKINANGREGVLIAILKQPGTNLVTLSQDVVNKVAEMKHILPPGVSMRPYYAQADFVTASVRSVTDSLLIGLILAIFVAIIFLRSIKASATILITIPVTICLSLLMMRIFGYTLNIMTLGAIAAAIGLIIDDAIVVVEQIHRTHEEHPEEKSGKLVQKAIHYLFPAMLGSSLSTIVIFIPFEIMSGVAGAYFKVMTNTMIITLASSFFVTWICLPVIYLLLTRDKIPQQISDKDHKIVKQQKWVSWFIMRPYVSIIFLLVLAVSTYLIFPFLQTGFLPEMDEGSIVLDYKSPPGTSLVETDLMLQQVEKIITHIPEVEAYSRRTGTQMGFFITEPNNGDYLIQLKKERSRTSEEVISEIREKVEQSQPALQIDFGQVIGDMLGDLMESVQPIEIKIYGDDINLLHDLSKRIATLVENIDGAADISDGVIISGPSISIIPDNTMLSQYGLTPRALQMQVQLALQGIESGAVQNHEQLSAIRLVYPGASSQSLEGIKNLRVFLPSGKLIPITSLATVKVISGESEIERENLQSIGVVTGRLENKDLGSTMRDIQENISSSIALPLGYHIAYGGAYAGQQQSFRELLMILISSSLLVFGVLLFLFRDFRVAFLILLLSVFGITGCYFALFLTNTPLNVGSYTGIIMIVGIIAENAIFTYLQFRESLTETSNVDQSVVYAVSTRLRPKLMTAIGAIIALMPLAIGIGTGAELHQPLAIAVTGGFIVALPLLLIVLPAMLRLIFARQYSGVNTSNIS